MRAASNSRKDAYMKAAERKLQRFVEDHPTGREALHRVAEAPLTPGMLARVDRRVTRKAMARRTLNAGLILLAAGAALAAAILVNEASQD